jgi:hypothetical protein
LSLQRQTVGIGDTIRDCVVSNFTFDAQKQGVMIMPVPKVSGIALLNAQ